MDFFQGENYLESSVADSDSELRSSLDNISLAWFGAPAEHDTGDFDGLFPGFEGSDSAPLGDDFSLDFGISEAQPGQQVVDTLDVQRPHADLTVTDLLGLPEVAAEATPVVELRVLSPVQKGGAEDDDTDQIIAALRDQIKALSNKPKYQGGLKKIRKDCTRMIRTPRVGKMSDKCKRCKEKHYTAKKCSLRTDGRPCACCEKAGVTNCERDHDNRYRSAPNGRWAAQTRT